MQTNRVGRVSNATHHHQQSFVARVGLSCVVPVGSIISSSPSRVKFMSPSEARRGIDRKSNHQPLAGLFILLLVCILLPSFRQVVSNTNDPA